MPPHSDTDFSYIEGNFSPAAKRNTIEVFREVAVGSDGSFGYDVGTKVVCSRIDVGPHPEDPHTFASRIVFDLRVDKSMLNGDAKLDKGCVAYLTDICSSMALVAQGVYIAETKHDPTAIERSFYNVSLSLSMVHHASAKEGALLKINSYSVTSNNQVHTVRCEIWDATNGTLISTGNHSKLSPSPPRKTQSKL